MALPLQTSTSSGAPRPRRTHSSARSAHGTARIDALRAGDLRQGPYRGGHFYSNKAPGLALVILPAYEALHATGLLPGDRRGCSSWLFGLWSAVLPAAVMLLLARLDRGPASTPGTGTLVAVALGLCDAHASARDGRLRARARRRRCCSASFAIAMAQRHSNGRILLLLVAGLIRGLRRDDRVSGREAWALVIGLYAACARATDPPPARVRGRWVRRHRTAPCSTTGGRSGR